MDEGTEEEQKVCFLAADSKVTVSPPGPAAKTAKSLMVRELESDEESLAGAAHAISNHSVSDTGAATAYPGDTSRVSSSTDTGNGSSSSTSWQFDGACSIEQQALHVPALVQKPSSGSAQGRADVPATYDVPLPFPKSKDISALLSLNLDKLELGSDTRTTVMLARIPKTCSPDRFLVRLRDLSLLNKVRFYYMPTNAVRNRPCGYVFLDFQESADVARLCKSLRLLENLLGCRQDRKIQINFARIQGWRALLQHFSGSELTYEPDASLRPQFFFPRCPEPVAVEAAQLQ